LIITVFCGGGTKFDTTPAVRTIAGDSAGKVYVGLGEKISIFDGNVWQTISLTTILSSEVNTIFVDNTGTIWIGAKDGIYKIYEDKVEHIENTFSILKCADVHQITSDSDNNLWFTIGCISLDPPYWWGGVVKLAGSTWTSYPMEDFIAGIDEHKDKGIYAFSYFVPEPRLYKFDGSMFISVTLPVYSDVLSMSFDSKGNLWLSQYNMLSKCVTDTECESFSAEMQPNLNAIDIDNQDNVWLGTQNGLVMFDGINFTYYTKDSTGGKLGSDDVFTVKVIGSTVWAGTMSGLSSFDGENWTQWEWDGEVWHAK